MERERERKRGRGREAERAGEGERKREGGMGGGREGGREGERNFAQHILMMQYRGRYRKKEMRSLRDWALVTSIMDGARGSPGRAH